jgi:hypothetical protein
MISGLSDGDRAQGRAPRIRLAHHGFDRLAIEPPPVGARVRVQLGLETAAGSA